MDEQDEQQLDLNTEELQQQLAEARAEAEKNLNGWKRSEADFRNYQRRKEQEDKELVDFAREVAVAKLLPSLDTLTQALKHQPEATSEKLKVESEKFIAEYQTWLNGVDGLVKQLDKALEELGVKKVGALGKKFDPNLHEAVREVPGEEDGLVVEEYQTGFELNGKLIRPSQVAISKKE